MENRDVLLPLVAELMASKGCDEWMELLGRSHEMFYKLKEALHRYDDDFFNRLARTANGVAPGKRTLARVMMAALVRHPTLIPLAAQLFVQELC